jgi:uncharacterized membrane protein
MTDGLTLSSTARLEAFSDGVFAIAITLLVLEIRVPSIEATAQGRALVSSLRQLWPSYLGYLISFVTLGIIWANHHNMFRYVRRTDFHFYSAVLWASLAVPGILAGLFLVPEHRGWLSSGS